MATPPKKPSPDESGGLEEVERALSVLGGRHPEAVRAAREADEAKARKEAERSSEAAEAAGRRRRRGLLVAAAGVVLVAVGGLLLWVRSRSKEHSAAFAAKAAPITSRGFVELPDLGGKPQLQIDEAGAACFAIVADPRTPGAAIDVTRGPTVTHAAGDALLCTCGDESIVASSSAELRVYRAPAVDVGGVLALQATVAEGRTIVPGSEACDVDHLRDWARAGRAPAAAASPLVAPKLAELGFTPDAGRSTGLPFVFVTPTADRCVVAVAPDGATLALVAKDANLPPPARALAVCDAKGNGAILRVEGGPGDVRVAAVPAKRVGGLLGFREALTTAGIDAAVWVSDDDRAFFAEETLRASLVPEPKSVAGAALLANAATDARVILVTAKDGAMYVAEGPPEATFLCAPTMSAASPESLCVQTKAHSWHLPRPDAVGALAYGVLPFWMSGLASVPQNRAGEALAPELGLLRLARRLAARGFDPTIVEGVREREQGVDVLGRSGEDAVVVVGVWPAPPWVYPYEGWGLDEEPRVLPLRGGDHLELVAKPAPSVPVAIRRTVVFRHAAK